MTKKMRTISENSTYDWSLRDYPGNHWIFGKPILISGGLGVARWAKGDQVLGTHQKGTGWAADLYGGVQSGDDWAACYIPVNDIPVKSFTEAQWSWYQTATETMGLGIVIWIHDPADFDKRAEVSQVGGIAGLDKSAGWNSHEWSISTTQMFYYGENTTGSGLTAGTQYKWSEFQADTVFKGWTIYRISFDWGWEASGTFESAYLAEVKLNGVNVPIKPEGNTHKKRVTATKTIVDGAHSADDVVSEDADNGEGTDWDFNFGGTGYITSAIIGCAKNAITPILEFQLYTVPPTCELDDNAAATSPVAADMPYALPPIVFEAMHDSGTGHSYAVASMSTTGNLPIYFDSPIVYGVLIDKTGVDFDASLMTITLCADMED